MKVTVSSPDLRPSLVGVLQGLAGAGAIDRVITTLAFSPTGAVSRLAARRSSRLRGLIRRRHIPQGLERFVECIPFGELLLQASGRLGLGDGVHHRVWMWAEPYFDQRVAERLAGRTGVLYGHEHASRASFDAQKRVGGLCLLRQVNAHFAFLDAIQDEEHDRFGTETTRAWRQLLDSRPTVNARKLAEYEMADLIVANSSFVRRTFLDAGVSAEKVVVVPTGCPTPVAVCPQRIERRKLVLCAGHLSLRKGTPYLLEAWRRLAPDPADAELVFAGRNMLPARLLADLPAGSQCIGTVDGTALNALYDRASVLVLPTLCEGLAHVIPEALSRGLPVITTPNSGGEGLISNGVNGWIVPVRAPDALADRIHWCLSHPDDLARMAAAALDTARAWGRSRAVAAHVELVLGVARAERRRGADRPASTLV